ncbi:hypothetical protein FNV43_RR16758 [Rhamnella rubrinervis]|uniref:DUF7870 domain-containing protein n=1 Tax=Rhamnella rubrinervis TaxID=2594499 RepID=A0A8K0GZF3_9ROSA|nr:hypothetical protein FNV43_RR16758 [Rhamnella rubrinervis]
MELKAAKFQILHGSIARRVLFRAFMFASAISIVLSLHILSGPYLKIFSSATVGDCVAMHLGNPTANFTAGRFLFQGRFINPIWGSFEPTKCEEAVNLTVTVVRELVGKQLLNYGAKALCVGEGSDSAVSVLRDLGFSNAHGVEEHRIFLLKRKRFVQLIDYEEKSFDFVFSRDLDKVSVPALLVLEIERVLSPGGIGALLGGTTGSRPNSLIRSAIPVSSVLKASSVVHVNHINGFTLVVFRKRFENVGYFGQYRLPADCPSFVNNKPFIGKMEALVEEKPIWSEKRFSYLPRLVDFSSKKKLVYIEIGAGEHLNHVTNWFPPSYPIERKAFSVYFVDHNTSVLSSYVKKPGITFVYHPGLSGNKDKVNLSIDGDLEPLVGETEFDFLAWFKETVQQADFVVLKMNAGEMGLKFLSELFESGTICFVDELFLRCTGRVEGEGATRVDCMNLFKDLRSSGVYVHQWWGDYKPTNVW